ENKDQTMQVTTGNARDQAITIFRNGTNLDLGGRLDNLRINMPRVQVMMTPSRAGIHVQEMTSQLRDFFGVNGNDGVLVSSIDNNSVAAKAGLKVGDVITAVDNHPVRNSYDLSVEMRSNTKVTVHVVRDKKAMDVVVDRTTDTR